MYLLDSNVFIQSKNYHYAFDFCPAFWDFLIQQYQKEKVYSIDKVKGDIIRGNDELVAWANNDKLNGFFLPSDTQTAEQFQHINEMDKSKALQTICYQ